MTIKQDIRRARGVWVLTHPHYTPRIAILQVKVSKTEALRLIEEAEGPPPSAMWDDDWGLTLVPPPGNEDA